MKTKTPVFTIASLLRARVASARGDVKYARDRLADARAERADQYDPDIQTVLDLVKASGLEVLGSPYLSRSTWSHHSGISISVQVDGLKVPAVVGLIAALDAIAPADTTEDHASEWSASRSFEFKRDGLRIRLSCEIAETSETCKRVKIGTKLRETAEYAIICN